jgi:hypothetical protein
MNSKKIKFVLGIILVALLSTGCIGVDRGFRSIRDYVLDPANNQFEKEFEFSFGTVSVTMAELALKFTDVEEPIDEILSEISNVQVGIYKNNSDVKINPTIEEAKYLTNKMKKAGWDCIVRSVDRNEMTAVFVKSQDDELNRLFVISVNNDEVVLAEILGNLHKVIEIAIREKGLNFTNLH